MSTSDYGTLEVLDQAAIFQKHVAFIESAIQANPKCVIGLTGGSTPKAFYEWAIKNNALNSELAQTAYWSTSDERLVPLQSEESNFGNADRQLLTPLNIPEDKKLHWSTHTEAQMAATIFNRDWNERFGESAGFDVCFLGMGDDCHTASLFPKNRLLGSGMPEKFAWIEVAGKGQRLTITEAGLAASQKIVITVTGEGKAQALQEVFEGDFNPNQKPAQVLKNYSEKVTWLVDPAAASRLKAAV